MLEALTEACDESARDGNALVRLGGSVGDGPFTAPALRTYNTETATAVRELYREMRTKQTLDHVKRLRCERPYATDRPVKPHTGRGRFRHVTSTRPPCTSTLYLHTPYMLRVQRQVRRARARAQRLGSSRVAQRFRGRLGPRRQPAKFGAPLSDGGGHTRDGLTRLAAAHGAAARHGQGAPRRATI